MVFTPRFMLLVIFPRIFGLRMFEQVIEFSLHLGNVLLINRRHFPKSFLLHVACHSSGSVDSPAVLPSFFGLSSCL